MTSYSQRPALLRQSELSLSLSAIFGAGALFSLLAATVFPPERPHHWLLTVAVTVSALCIAVLVLVIGRHLTQAHAGGIACAYTLTLLFLTAVSLNQTRGVVSGLLIVVMIIYFAWFMPLWFTRIAAYVFLGAFAVIMLVRHPSPDTSLVVTVICALSFMLIEVFGRFKVNLHNASLTDHLCQVWNRAGLEALLDREIRVVARSGAPLALLYVDLDGFKHVNDQHGHQAGDNVLRAVARSLVQGVRPNDTVARIGGDEFVVVLPNTTGAEARVLAARLRHTVDACSWTFGVAEFQSGETVYEFMDRSDRELIARKQARPVARPPMFTAEPEGEAVSGNR